MPNPRLSSPPPPKDDPRFDDWLIQMYRRGNSREIFTQAQTAARTVADVEAGQVFTNEGAGARVDFTLPPAVAGLNYYYYCANVNGVRVIAASGDKIRIGASLSAAAGRIDSVTVGSTVFLHAINADEWVAMSVSGTWVVT